jgi:hypothetical protein
MNVSGHECGDFTLSLRKPPKDSLQLSQKVKGKVRVEKIPKTFANFRNLDEQNSLSY